MELLLGSSLIILINEHSPSNHLPANPADPLFLLCRVSCNQAERTLCRLHTEGVLLPCAVFGTSDRWALRQAHILRGIGVVALSLEAAEILRSQHEPTLSPLLEVLGLLHHEALHGDVILVDHNLLHRTKRLESRNSKSQGWAEKGTVEPKGPWAKHPDARDMTMPRC